ncbi:hypothetical protein [Campylobacter sp. MIT 97-5078]|nr:hypothetical protein [Campylobacter sp. MIT 97-5078]
MNIFQSIGFFFLACLFEVGGAYLVWLWAMVFDKFKPDFLIFWVQL